MTSYVRLISEIGSKEDWRYNVQSNEKQRQRYMLDYNICADCTFEVGHDGSETKIFEAHKFMLIRESRVFEATFSNQEVTNGKIIKLNDIQPWAFQVVLEYLYTGDLNVRKSKTKELEELFHVAEKFQMIHLMTQCLDLISENVNVSNVWRCYTLASDNEHEMLREACAKVVQENTKEIIKSEAFLTLSEKQLIFILEQNTLSIPELELIDACVDWAENITKRRGLFPSMHLKEEDPTDSLIRAKLSPNIISKLRFLTLTNEEFSIIEMYNWLTENEKIEILNVKKGKENSLKLPDHISKNNESRYQNPIPASICSRPIDSSMQSTLLISVDRDISLLGITVPSQTKSNINIVPVNTAKKYNENLVMKFYKIEESGHRPYNVYRLELQQIVKLEKSISYNSLIQLKFNNPELLEKSCYYYITVDFNSKGYYPSFKRHGDVIYGHTTIDFSIQKDKFCTTNDSYVHSLIFVNK